MDCRRPLSYFRFMNALRVWVFALALISLAGCATVQPQENVQLPETTPFDHNSMARQVYLDAYRDGYRTAAKGQIVNYDFLPGPYRFAKELGLRAGVAKARSDLEAKPTNKLR
jgi:hypothetical protein